MKAYLLRISPVAAAGDLVCLGSPDAMGGRVLEGTPEIFARVDYQEDGMSAGIFEVTTGKMEVFFPFTEHATILEGEVTLTDEGGQSRTYRPGDSYFIQAGQSIVVEVKSPRLRKSFFNVLPRNAPQPAGRVSDMMHAA